MPDTHLQRARTERGKKELRVLGVSCLGGENKISEAVEVMTTSCHPRLVVKRLIREEFAELRKPFIKCPQLQLVTATTSCNSGPKLS